MCHADDCHFDDNDYHFSSTFLVFCGKSCPGEKYIIYKNAMTQGKTSQKA